MIGDYYTFNGDLRPAAEAVVPIDDIAFAYGYGVYETLKLRKGVVFFPDRHAEGCCTLPKSSGSPIHFLAKTSSGRVSTCSR